MAEATKKTADSAGKSLPVPVAVKRGGVVQFVREAWREGIEKVTWPSWKETYLTTIMVFIMVGAMMLFFFGVDWLLALGEGWILRSAG
ncbi:MAG: preprotein translocase subunit SecE [Rhizomicrobium sp.]